MPNHRIFWPCQAVGLAPLGSNTFTPIHGLQSVSITTSFPLEPVFEISQASIYQQIDDIPDVEVNLEKVVDGYPLMFHLATRGYPSNTLIGRSNQRTSLALSIFGDVQDSASGTPVSQLVCSGMYFSNVAINVPVTGPIKESLSLVGNDKVWKTSSYTFSGSLFDNTDSPLNLTSGGNGVQTRRDVVFGTLTDTLLPPSIPGISSSGTNYKNSNNEYNVSVQSIQISAGVTREAIYELGSKKPVFRYAQFPVEVRTEIEVITKSGDFVSASETTSLNNETIALKLQDSTYVHLGTKNKLTNVTYGGADAGGGNATCTYSYTTYNDFTVTHNQDPVT